MNIQLTIQYHASLREHRGRASEEIQTEARTPAELVASLDLPLAAEHLKVAVNDHFVDWDSPLQDGDTVLLIPPVAGG